jgi:hypothetical protein
MLVLLGLFFAHFLADFSHLALPFQAAKKFGKPLQPILHHALWHGFLMLPFVVYASPNPTMWGLLFGFEVGTHFLIDTLKGRCNGWFPILQDPTKPAHWYAFGFDQFLHTTVIITIWHLCQ